MEKCLLSLAGEPADIIVVDNGSVDGSREVVEQKFPEVRCIAWKENRGFCLTPFPCPKFHLSFAVTNSGHFPISLPQFLSHSHAPDVHSGTILFQHGPMRAATTVFAVQRQI